MTLAALFMVAAGAWAQVNVAPAGSQGNQWTFQMPASNVQLRVNYYALPELAWRQAQTQTPVQDPVTGYVGFESLTAFPALHNPHTLSPIRYVSTNPAAATINSEGIVTFVAPGTTTIRAVFDGDNDYQEDSVAYVLNVLAPCTLTLAQNEPNWGSVTLAGTPDSVKALENGTYHVVPGKVVTVNATANELHHVAGWKDENRNDLATATYSSYFVTNPTMMFPANSTLTFTVTGDTTATAMFGINSYEVSADVADGQSGRGMVHISYTDVQGNPHTTAAGQSATASAQGGSTSTLVATPADGYHFVCWTNGNDTLGTNATLTTNVALAATAEFDTNTYVLTVAVTDGQSDRGTVAGSTTAKHFLTYEISATPSTGYHFTQWSDGITDNPRTVTLTCDSTFTADFDTNTYVLTVVVADGQNDRGTVAGSTTAKHFLTYEISATPNTGYHFTQWSDGNTDNPRTVTLTRDSTFTAVFDTNTYVLTVAVTDGQSDRGTVAGSTTAKHFLTYEISATPNTGYHFEQWSDGNTDNPRTVTLTCDSTFTAEFEPNIYTIIYMDWETALDTVTYKYRDNIAEYIPQHGGRTFLGWLPAVPVTMPAEDLTVSAQWSCDPVTHDGHEYSAVIIGGLCWTAENLRATHYADGTEITNIYRYQSAMSPDMAGNASTYGLLYDWYDAVNAERPTKAAHVQGICPDNWRLPNEEDFAMLSSMNLHSLRSTDYWVSNNGSNTTGLDMRPAGMYNISTSRYEDLHSSAYFWSVDAAGATEAHCHEANYYCDTFLHHIRNKGNAFSVRCVRD